LQPAGRLLTSEARLCPIGLFNVTIYSAQQLQKLAKKKTHQGKHT